MRNKIKRRLEIRKVLWGCCLAAMVSIPVKSQSGSAPQQAPPMDSMATYLKGALKTNANYLVKSAQEFPDVDVAGGEATMQDVAMEQVLDESLCHAARGEES